MCLNIKLGLSLDWQVEKEIKNLMNDNNKYKHDDVGDITTNLSEFCQQQLKPQLRLQSSWGQVVIMRVQDCWCSCPQTTSDCGQIWRCLQDTLGAFRPVQLWAAGDQVTAKNIEQF